jgi:uncharacterized membrane protein
MKNIEILDGFWRHSGGGVRLFIFSAWLTIPLLAFMLHITWFTFGALVLTLGLMWLIERHGFTIPVAVLAVRAFFAGRVVKRRRHFFAKQLDR